MNTEGTIDHTEILAALCTFRFCPLHLVQPATGPVMTNHRMWFWKRRKGAFVWFSHGKSMFEKQFTQPFNSLFFMPPQKCLTILSLQNGRMSTYFSFSLLPWSLKMMEKILNKLIIPVEHEKIVYSVDPQWWWILERRETKHYLIEEWIQNSKYMMESIV